MSRRVPVSSGADRPTPPRPPATFEEFLAWCDGDTRAEWVDGEVVLMSPARLDHQDVLRFIARLVSAFVDAHGLGYVYFAPVLMRLPTRPSGREPDLVFVASRHAGRLRDTYIDGPADLVVEIVSPDSEERDRVDKLGEYEAAGIPEYWLIDLPRREAAFYRLDPDGSYRSRVLPGFRLRVAWLSQQPLPRVADVLALTDPSPAAPGLASADISTPDEGAP